jgi:hypothetical protein
MEDNIKMDFREIGCGDVDWIHLAGCCKHGYKISESIEGEAFLD